MDRLEDRDELVGTGQLGIAGKMKDPSLYTLLDDLLSGRTPSVAGARFGR